jgi:hypothetical protein
MSTKQITIKPNNHRIYQCQQSKKIELLNKLIEESKSSDILVVCSKDADMIQNSIENKSVKVIHDKDLIKDKELKCEFLISYDMPIKAIVYMARVSSATDKAFMLLDEKEQLSLHSIETLLGRAIKQEILEDFRYEIQEEPKEFQKKIEKTFKI